MHDCFHFHLTYSSVFFRPIQTSYQQLIGNGWVVIHYIEHDECQVFLVRQILKPAYYVEGASPLIMFGLVSDVIVNSIKHLFADPPEFRFFGVNQPCLWVTMKVLLVIF